MNFQTTETKNNTFGFAKESLANIQTYQLNKENGNSKTKKYSWTKNNDTKEENNEKSSTTVKSFDWLGVLLGKIEKIDPEILREKLGEENYKQYLETVDRNGLITSEKIELPEKFKNFH